MPASNKPLSQTLTSRTSVYLHHLTMKASIFAVLSGAAAVMASPAALNKRVYETKWTTVVEVAYVTEGTPQATQPPAAPIAEVVTVTKAPEVEPIYAPTPAPVVVAPTTKQEAAPVPTYAPPAAGNMKEAAIYHHNLHRSNHSAPAMSWKDDIADAAQVAADSCVFAHKMYVSL